MDQQEIRCLNKILKGEHMAIGVYDEFIHNLNESELKYELITLRQEHILHAMWLSRLIEDFGGKPDDHTGLPGLMARLTARINTLRYRQPVEILQVICSGEDKGLARAEQITRQLLDQESREAMAEYFQDEHQHISQVHNLLQEYLH